MKAYRGQDDRVRLFRPSLNMARMLKSAHRACLPVNTRPVSFTCPTYFIHSLCWLYMYCISSICCVVFRVLVCGRVSTVQSCWSASGNWWKWIRTGFLTRTRPVSTSARHSWAQRWGTPPPPQFYHTVCPLPHTWPHRSSWLARVFVTDRWERVRLPPAMGRCLILRVWTHHLVTIDRALFNQNLHFFLE